jgi:2-dehydropantoate 2-reductase
LRILVLGAGATGGYFGGRLAQTGADVTFLVRPRRAAQLAANGLVIRSPKGEATVAAPKTLEAGQSAAPFELVLLSCKAYDLADAIESIAAHVGAATAILPVLNGMRHLELLDARFGRERVLAGQCVIAATLADDGAIVHLNQMHSLTFGERDGGLSERVRAIGAAMAKANFESHPSEQATQEMWEKWVVLATLAACTCLMRGSIGDILAAPAGRNVIGGIFDECCGIGAANGHAPRAEFLLRARATLTQEGSALTASMLRDIERGARIEADQIIGDLLERSGKNASPAAPPSLLQVAYCHLKAYEGRQARTANVPA